MSKIVSQDWFVWGIALILGFQILVVVLGELLYRADRGAMPISPILRAVRNVVLPLLVAYVFVLQILEVPEDAFAVRAIATAFYISVIYTGLLLFNALVFQHAPAETWRARAPSLFQDLVRITLVVIGAAIVLAVVWEQNLGGLIAALGVGSIVLGLALQETLGNLMAGIALLFERPFAIGDWIEVGDEQGAVVQINWRSVHVRTRERNLLVFPNSVLGRETIINYARPSSLQTMRLSFSFSLEDPPNAVKQTMLEVARSMDDVLEHPPPRAFVREVLEDRIRYEAFLAIDEPRRIPQIVDQYTTRIWYATRRAGLRLPLPAAYEIKLEEPVGTSAGVDVVSVLARAQGFQTLDEARLREVADQAEVLVYADGETVIAQDEVADAVFVVADGALHVTWAPADEVVAELFLDVYESVGVTSMSRQQASHTRVFCDDDVTLIRIPHSVVDACVQAHPKFAHEFARVAEVRANALERARAEYSHEGAPPDDQLLPASMRRPQVDTEDVDES